MRVAVLADIHGNLPACEAVLEDIERTAPDYIVAAGDLALRGAHPRETLQLLIDKCDALLMGNTDCYISGNYLGGAYRDRDHWKSELLGWTRDQLGSELVTRLGQLPFSMRYSPRRGQDLYVCHANPRNLEDSLDPTLDDNALRRYLAHLDAAAVAFGHLHFPYRRRFGRMVIADVASAGIPRDGDLRPCWGLFTFTPKGWRVQLRRVRYQVRKATQALTARKVPGGPLLVHKLVEARYRHHHALQEAARRHSGLPPIHASHGRPTHPGIVSSAVARAAQAIAKVADRPHLDDNSHDVPADEQLNEAHLPPEEACASEPVSLPPLPPSFTDPDSLPPLPPEGAGHDAEHEAGHEHDADETTIEESSVTVTVSVTGTDKT